MEKNKRIILALVTALIGLSLVSGGLAYQLLHPAKTEELRSRLFVFDWPRGTQNVTEGGLTIHLNFTITEDKLETIAVINDSRPIPEAGAFCLAFDANNNSLIDPGDGPPRYNGTWLLLPNNMSQIGMTWDWGWVVTALSPPQYRDFHYCIYNGTHYIYTIAFPLKEFPNDIVQIVYQGWGKSYVSVRFHFGLI